MENNFKLCSVKQIEDQGVVRFRLTERMVDRDSEVIEPAGIKLDNFKKNPQFLWSHDIWGDNLPIGKVLMNTIEQKKEYLDANVMFDLEDEFAARVYKKYLGGYLTSGSIRFIPKAWARDPVLPNQKGLTITESELLEFSAVIVPANPGAVVIEKELFPKNSKLYEIAERFQKARNYDHNDKGWIDFLNQKNGDLDVNENNKTVFDMGNGIKFEVNLTNKIIEFSDGSILDFKDLKPAPEIIEFEVDDGDHSKEATDFLNQYDLKEWNNIASAMNDLVDLEADEEVKKEIYDVLSELYVSFEKEPPELKAVIKNSTESDETSETSKDEEVSLDDILDGVINNLTNTKEETNDD